jgi:hypothetical protein
MDSGPSYAGQREVMADHNKITAASSEAERVNNTQLASHIIPPSARPIKPSISPPALSRLVGSRQLLGLGPYLGLESYITRLDVKADSPHSSWQPRVKLRSRPHSHQFTRISTRAADATLSSPPILTTASCSDPCQPGLWPPLSDSQSGVISIQGRFCVRRTPISATAIHGSVLS